jgi:hypothetical protein
MVVTIDGYWIDNWIYWITHSTHNYSYSVSQCIHSTTHYSRPQHKAGNSSSACVPLQPTLLSILPGPRTSCWLFSEDCHCSLFWSNSILHGLSVRVINLGTDRRENNSSHYCLSSRYQVTLFAASEQTYSVHVTLCYVYTVWWYVVWDADYVFTEKGFMKFHSQTKICQVVYHIVRNKHCSMCYYSLAS